MANRHFRRRAECRTGKRSRAEHSSFNRFAIPHWHVSKGRIGEQWSYSYCQRKPAESRDPSRYVFCYRRTTSSISGRLESTIKECTYGQCYASGSSDASQVSFDFRGVGHSAIVAFAERVHGFAYSTELRSRFSNHQVDGSG